MMDDGFPPQSYTDFFRLHRFGGRRVVAIANCEVRSHPEIINNDLEEVKCL
jgi:hypothetical protein